MNRVIASNSTWLNKVPEVTLTFWLIKMMSTTVGETAADFLNVNLGFGLTGTSAVIGVLLAVFLGLQITARRYIPWRYWSVVVFISVFGTLVTDNLSDNLGVPLVVSTLTFSAALLVTFGIWYAKERTLSIHSINSIKRELFYWTAILLTFALGTAAGDWVAEGLSLGYANSALMFGALIGVAAVARFVFHRSAVTTFWLAYILTRPFGASCGDLLSQPFSNGGLGLGVVGTSAAFVVAIIGLVLYLSISERAAARKRI